MLPSSQLNLPWRLRQPLPHFPWFSSATYGREEVISLRISRLVPWRTPSTVLSADERDPSESQHQLLQAHLLGPILQPLGSLCPPSEILFPVLSLVESLVVPYHRLRALEALRQGRLWEN